MSTTTWWSMTMSSSTTTRTRRSSTRHAPAARSVTTTRTTTTTSCIADDDVEADLDKILKDRMVAVEDDEDEDEDEEVDVRGDGAERLQPKQQDEQLCPSCFLLVRASAPELSRRRRRLPDLLLTCYRH